MKLIGTEEFVLNSTKNSLEMANNVTRRCHQGSTL